MKNLLIIMIFLITSSFLAFRMPSKSFFYDQLFRDVPEYEIPEPDRLMGEVIDRTVKSIREKYDIYPIGVGMGGKFRCVSISFQIEHPLSKDEARAIVLDCKSIFLNEINSEEGLKPYLENYPFEHKNTSITLFITGKNDSKLFHPDICVARSNSEGFGFRTNDPDRQYKYKESIEETQEEALAHVEEYLRKQQTKS